MLLRLDASTIWFRDLILPNAEIRLFDDRLHFINIEGKQSRSDHASILAVFNGSKKRANIPPTEQHANTPYGVLSANDKRLLYLQSLSTLLVYAATNR